MKGNALKSVCKYIGLCMIGTLISAVYIPYAHADICFLPGGSCFADEDGASCDTSCDCVGSNCCPSPDCGVNRGSSCDGDLVSYQISGRACDLVGDDTFCCHNSCLSGYERSSNGDCILSCPSNCPRRNGVCTANPGYEMCQDRCLPKQQTGHRKLECPNYVCEQGYEVVSGLDGCFATCNISGQVHNSTTGACECVSTQEVCNNSCVDKCPVGKVRNSDTCVCEDGVPSCESPKEYLTTINNVKTCADCRDYTLRDRYSDIYCSDYYSGDYYSYGYTDNYSYPSESCSQVTTNGRFVHDVQNGGGYCNRCPIPRSNPTTQAKNRYKCYAGNIEVTNYADFCYALGYTYNTSGAVCSSPFTATTGSGIRMYNSDISSVRSTLNGLNALGTSGFEASPCTACPFDTRFYKCSFKCTYFTQSQANSSSDYTCVQCPGRYLASGNDGYFCTKRCATGLTWDEDLQECVSPCQGYKDLDPISLCGSASECGLQSPENILGYSMSGYSISGSDGYSVGPHQCQIFGDEYPSYTVEEAAKLRKKGYFCSERKSFCPGMYDCEPVKPLANAVRENSGTCSECGSNPKKYQCSIGNVTIDEPSDLCDYLGFTISQLDYWSYFDGKIGVASCQVMPCGVGSNQYGFVMSNERYKCQCRAGYAMTTTGCQKSTPDCPEGSVYSDNISGCMSVCPVGYTYSGGECIPPVGPKGEDDCWAEGYIWTGNEPEFECEYYIASICEKCPYDNKWLRCDKNENWSGGCGTDDGCEGESDNCEIDNVTKCQREGYYQYPMGIALINCKDCPYPTDFRMVKDCEQGNSCGLLGYNTPFSQWADRVAQGKAICETCPTSPEWVRNCREMTCDEGNSDACSSGEIIPELTPQEKCVNAGYHKITTAEVRMINEGSGSCSMCAYTNSLALSERYVKNCNSARAQCEAEYYVTSEEQKNTLMATGNYTCEVCPYWNKLYRCNENPPVIDPCADYTIVPCPSTTHQCTESVPECGCIQCQEAPGVFCNQGEVCSVALNAWGKCEGTCSCEGVTCTNDKVCTSLNPCGKCPSEENCICPGTECNGNEFCNGTTNQCDNCTSNCEAKTCATYGYQSSKTCSEHKRAKLVSASSVGGLVCYECVDKVCSDYDSSYKTSTSACPNGYYTYNPRLGLTCYKCKACTETCFGESFSGSLPCSGEEIKSCTTCSNYTRYFCDGYSDDSYSDDGYSDQISNGGGGNCNCSSIKCKNVSCYKACDNDGFMGSRSCWCEINGSGCSEECCGCDPISSSRTCSYTSHCVDEKHCGDN